MPFLRVLLFAAAAAAQVPTEPLDPGRLSPREERRVFRDAADWSSFWEEVDRAPGHCPRRRPPPSLPAPDFSRKLAVLAAGGAKSSTGYALKITGVVDAGAAVEVTVTQSAPEPGAIVGMAFTCPQDLVLIERSGKEVRFVEKRAPAAGRGPAAMDCSRLWGGEALDRVRRRPDGTLSEERCRVDEKRYEEAARALSQVRWPLDAAGAKVLKAFVGERYRGVEARLYASVPGPAGPCRLPLSVRFPPGGEAELLGGDSLGGLGEALALLKEHRIMPGLRAQLETVGCDLEPRRGALEIRLFWPAPRGEDDFEVRRASGSYRFEYLTADKTLKPLPARP